MKRLNKKILTMFFISFLVIFSLLIALVRGCSSQNNKNQSVYLALGDGLALGVNSQGLIGESYADYFGKSLMEAKKIKKYYKDFSRYNMKSSELLKIIERDAIGIIENESYKVSNLIRGSKVITLSIGLQDFITCFTYSSQNKTLSFNQQTIQERLEMVQLNIFQIIEEIKTINETAKIFLLGYYFLYPWIELNQRATAIAMFGEINEYYQEIARDSEVTYIDISAVGDQQYLPSLVSTYPDIEGYKLIANTLQEAYIDI